MDLPRHPDEMELSTDEPAGDDNPVVDEPEPIGPVSVGKPFDPLNAPLLGEDPVPREEPLLRKIRFRWNEPPVELLLPVASCAHAEPGERMVAPISNVEAPKALGKLSGHGRLSRSSCKVAAKRHPTTRTVTASD